MGTCQVRYRVHRKSWWPELRSCSPLATRTRPRGRCTGSSGERAIAVPQMVPGSITSHERWASFTSPVRAHSASRARAATSRSGSESAPGSEGCVNAGIAGSQGSLVEIPNMPLLCDELDEFVYWCHRKGPSTARRVVDHSVRYSERRRLLKGEYTMGRVYGPVGHPIISGHPATVPELLRVHLRLEQAPQRPLPPTTGSCRS
jgi:hypothetical protein